MRTSVGLMLVTGGILGEQLRGGPHFKKLVINPLDTERRKGAPSQS